MVFDPFTIDRGRDTTDTQRQQKLKDHGMALSGKLRDDLAFFCQPYWSVWFCVDISVAFQPGHSAIDRDMTDSETL